MAKTRCFLCGGRVSNGVCTECGMPQRQHVKDYDLNKSDCDDKPLTHVHEDVSYRTDRSYKQSTYAERQRKTEYRKATGKSSGKLVGIIVVIIVILIVVSVINNAVINNARLTIKDMFDNEFDLDWNENQDDTWTEDYSALTLDDAEYDYAVYDIPEEGAAYDAYLAAGTYKVGCHLPEGTYDLLVLYGYGTIDVEDDENGCYIYEWLDSNEDGGYGQIYNLRLYQGAKVYVSDGVELKLSTTNAQSEKMLEGVPNTLTETVSVGNEPLQAGRDFPAGVYDIYSMEGSGVVDIYVSWDEDDDQDYTYLDSEMLQSVDDADSEGRMEGYALKICNVELEDGMYIDGNGMPLELIPSDIVFPQEGE